MKWNPQLPCYLGVLLNEEKGRGMVHMLAETPSSIIFILFITFIGRLSYHKVTLGGSVYS